VTSEDTTTVVLDGISMGIEVAGIAGAIPTSGWGFVIAELGQLGLDLLGAHGAAAGFMNLTFYKRVNMGYTSDDVLGVLGAVPVVGLVTDVADIYRHATGRKSEWRP
jgi:hypothetical protein